MSVNPGLVAVQVAVAMLSLVLLWDLTGSAREEKIGVGCCVLHCVIAVSCNFVKGALVISVVYHPYSIEFFGDGEEDNLSCNDDANNGL